MSKITYLFNLIFNPENAAFIASNSIYMYYAKIPARVVPGFKAGSKLKDALN